MMYAAIPYGAASTTKLDWGYYVGPGGYVYAVGVSINPPYENFATILWSPKTRSATKIALSGAQLTAVLNELSTSGKNYGMGDQARQAALQAGMATSGGTTAGNLLSTLTGGGLPGVGAPASGKITDKPWFWPSVIGVGAIGALFIFLKVRKS